MDRPLAVFARRIRLTFDAQPAHAKAFRLALLKEGMAHLSASVGDNALADKVGAGLDVIEAAYAQAART